MKITLVLNGPKSSKRHDFGSEIFGRQRRNLDVTVEN